MKQILLINIIFIVYLNFLDANPCINKIDEKKLDAEELYILGLMYKKGICVEKNMKKSFQYFQSSHSEKYAFSIYELANMYYYGEGIKKDLKKAFYLYKSILINKVLEATVKTNIGYMYLKGEGVKKDVNLAKNYYLDASKFGNAYASYNLGLLYLSGLGVKKNIAKAIQYFQIASNKNYPDAQYKLAQALMIVNKEKYLNKALDLLKSASKNGSIDAKIALDYLKSKDTLNKEKKGLGVR